jgi:DnaJ family protein A protein 1
MKMEISLTDALCGFRKTVRTLDDRILVIQTVKGEVVKNGDLKLVYSEGMPTYRNPFEKGRLIVHFSVKFPETIEPSMAEELARVLPASEEPMIPDDHEEVDMHHFDPEADRAQQNHRGQYDEDDDDHHHGQGVSCATQ